MSYSINIFQNIYLYIYTGRMIAGGGKVWKQDKI